MLGMPRGEVGQKLVPARRAEMAAPFGRISVIDGVPAEQWLKEGAQLRRIPTTKGSQEATDEVRSIIASRADSGTLTRIATGLGMTTMFEHAVAKCRAGTTSAAEVLRVTTVR